MLYEERVTVRRDTVMMMNRAIREGREEGIAEGRAEGKAEGRAEGIYNAAANLMKLNIPTETIIKATGLSSEEIEAIK
jgi:predicted transposase/invertase (TIGR01784 family)